MLWFLPSGGMRACEDPPRLAMSVVRGGSLPSLLQIGRCVLGQQLEPHLMPHECANRLVRRGGFGSWTV